MDSQAPPTLEDLRADARNTLRLAEIAPEGREKAMLLHAANEFLKKAADLEASACDAPAHLATDFEARLIRDGLLRLVEHCEELADEIEREITEHG